MTTRSFYHPKSMQGALLLQQTVGRQRLLEELLAFLHQTADFSRQTTQPWLLRGIRGVGKTHFLSILAERLREEGFFQEAFELVWLPETETNEIYSVGTLLRSLVEQIALSPSRGPSSDLSWVDQGLQRVLDRYAGDLAIFREDMLEIVKTYAQKSGKRLVVFIENLDLILREFSPRTRPQEEAVFRSIFQDQKEIIWICTSPSLRTDATHDPRRPLYGLFVERAIPALNEKETWELWRIAKQKTLRVGDSYTFFNTEDDASVSFEMFTKQKALYQLTGGKPRNIWILAEWMPDQGDVHAFQEALLRVLDMQTTFFEQEFLSVAPRERTILARLALSEHNLDLQEIARETALSPKSLSTHLSRLVDGGYLSRYELKKEKQTLFSLNNGLFRLWYRFRKYGRKDDLWSDFLGLWYAAASPLDQLFAWRRCFGLERGEALERLFAWAVDLLFREEDGTSEAMPIYQKDIESFLQNSTEPSAGWVQVITRLLEGYRLARVDLEWGAFRFLAELKFAVKERYMGFLALLLLRALWPVLPMTENWRTEFEGMEKLIEERKLPVHETTGKALQMYVEVSKIEMRYQKGLSAQEEEEMWLRWPEPLRTSLRVLVQKLAEERKAAKERSHNLQSKHPEA